MPGTTPGIQILSAAAAASTVTPGTAPGTQNPSNSHYSRCAVGVHARYTTPGNHNNPNKKSNSLGCITVDARTEPGPKIHHNIITAAAVSVRTSGTTPDILYSYNSQRSSCCFCGDAWHIAWHPTPTKSIHAPFSGADYSQPSWSHQFHDLVQLQAQVFCVYIPVLSSAHSATFLKTLHYFSFKELIATT